MAEKPKLTEILSVMGNDIKRYKGPFAKLVKGASYFMKGAGISFILPKYVSKSSMSKREETLEDFAFSCGICSGLVVDFAAPVFLSEIHHNYKYLFYWLLPITTNAVSGVYEWAKSASKRALENKISSETPVSEKPASENTNPLVL